MAAPTFNELYTAFKAEAQDRRADLTFDPGDIAEMMAYGGAAMADHVSAWAARRLAATYFGGATGDDLTILADDHFNIQRTEAVKAIGSVTFNRAAATAGAGTIDAGTVVATAKDNLGRETQLVTTAATSYGIAETGDKTATVEAVLAGIDGNLNASTVTRIVTGLWDSSITVSNPAAIAGGSAAETDSELLDRVKGFSLTIRRGTLAALEYGAKQVAGVAYATATEDSGGIVTVYVTDSAGSSNGTMEANVLAELENWRAAGILVYVEGGAVYNVTVALEVTARPGVDTSALVTKIKAAVVATVNKLKIGETLYLTQIKQAAMNVDPEGIAEIEVTTPALDLEPAATQLIRTEVGSVTVS
jgi:hypothetical protein